jgi:large repetitive protein
MKRQGRAFLSVEMLEQRWVPATVRFTAGTLFISNPTITAGGSNARVVQDAATANRFTVIDGSSSITFNGVASINYTGSNANDAVTLDLGGNTYTGSFTANTGNGNDTVTILSSGGDGVMRGNATLLTGAGNDVVQINSGGSTAVTIGGNVQVTNSLGNDSFAVGASAAFLSAGPPTTVSGNLTVTGVPNVTLGTGGAAVNVGGSLVIQDNLLGTPANITANDSLTVSKGVSIQTGSGADNVTIHSVNFNASGGSTQLNFGDGNDTVTLSPLFATTISGDLSLTEGNGNDTLDVSNASGLDVNGQTHVTYGSGNDSINIPSSSGGMHAHGNYSLIMGDGNDTIDLTGLTVDGNLALTLGNGTDVTTLGNAPGGLFTYRSGNGDDSLTLAPDSDGLWNVDITFGTGNDTLTLAGTGNEVITGKVDFGGPAGGNTLNQGANWTFGSPFSIFNE